MTPETETYIRLRTVECGECLLWEGRLTDNGGLPCMYVSGLSGYRAVRRIVYAGYRGEVPKGRVVTTTCGAKLCVAIAHLIAVPLRDAQRAAAKRGSYGKPASIRKSSLSARAKSWITDDIVAAVRAARTAKEAHEQTGVSLSHAKAIRSGTARKDWGSPFVGLLAANDSQRKRA